MNAEITRKLPSTGGNKMENFRLKLTQLGQEREVYHQQKEKLLDAITTEKSKCSEVETETVLLEKRRLELENKLETIHDQTLQCRAKLLEVERRHDDEERQLRSMQQRTECDHRTESWLQNNIDQLTSSNEQRINDIEQMEGRIKEIESKSGEGEERQLVSHLRQLEIEGELTVKRQACDEAERRQQLIDDEQRVGAETLADRQRLLDDAEKRAANLEIKATQLQTRIDDLEEQLEAAKAQHKCDMDAFNEIADFDC